MMLEEKTKFFKALGNETRLKIIRFLLENEYCACDITKKLNKDQTTISRHLKKLTEANILERERRGKNIIYRLKNEELKKKLQKLDIDEIEPCC